jgi:hypothetical protein
MEIKQRGCAKAYRQGNKKMIRHRNIKIKNERYAQADK